jgi:hypothetical protein
MPEIPSIQPKTTGWSRLIFCLIETMISAAMVAAAVAIIQGMNMSVGFAAGGLTDARIAIMLIGIRVSPDAWSTRNMICALLALSFSGLSS